MTRHLERLFLRFVLWAFALTELPHTDEVGDDCPCVVCAQKRRRRAMVLRMAVESETEAKR